MISVRQLKIRLRHLVWQCPREHNLLLSTLSVFVSVLISRDHDFPAIFNPCRLVLDKSNAELGLVVIYE